MLRIHRKERKKVKSLSCVRLFVTLWTVAYQAPLSRDSPGQNMEWVAISFSRESSWPRDWTRVSCIAGRCFNLWATREAELYEKQLHDPDNHDGVITHLEPDIPEYEVKWSLGSIATSKASGGDGIPVELFWILKDEAVKVLPSIYQQIWKTQAVATGLEKVSFHSYPKCQRTVNHTVISHASKVMLKILQTRLPQYVTHKLPDA